MEGKRRKRMNPLEAALVVAGTFGAGTMIETFGNLGDTRYLENEYSQTLAQARENYDRLMRSGEGQRETNYTFERYCGDHDIPTREEVEAVQTLIDTYEYPVRVRSGFSSTALYARVIGLGFMPQGLYNPVAYRVYGEHNIWVNSQGMLTRETLRALVEELAHVYQNEHRTPLVERSSVFRDLFNPSAAYDDQGDRENEAHTRISPTLHDTVRFIRDTYRSRMLTKVYESFFGTSHEAAESMSEEERKSAIESMTKEEFDSWLTRLEESTSTQYTFVDTQLVLQLLEALPSSDVREIRLGNNTPRLMFSRSDAFYQEFMTFIDSPESAARLLTQDVLRSRFALDTYAQVLSERNATEYLFSAFRINVDQMFYPSADISSLRLEGAPVNPDSFELRYYNYRRGRPREEFTYDRYVRMMQMLEQFVTHPEEYRAHNDEVIVQAAESVLTVVNGACLYDNSCAQEYGVHASRIRGRPARVVMDTSARGAHYQALKRHFDARNS